MVVVGVDFRKAFDSVKREKILDVLKEYRIPEDVLEVFREVYSIDKTRVELGEYDHVHVEVQVESGIRQGCTASTLLFKLITYKMIEALRRRIEGVRIGQTRISSLFYVDDGLILARSLPEAREGVAELTEVAWR